MNIDQKMVTITQWQFSYLKEIFNINTFESETSSFELIQGPVQLPVQTFQLDSTQARSLVFTEQESFATIPLHETSIVSDVAVTKGKMNRSAGKMACFVHLRNYYSKMYCSYPATAFFPTDNKK